MGKGHIAMSPYIFFSPCFHRKVYKAVSASTDPQKKEPVKTYALKMIKMGAHTEGVIR